MAQLGARKDSLIRAVCSAPTINKTPVGNTTPPLPYPVTQDLSNSVGVVPTVRFNGKAVYVLNQSKQSSCVGDAVGTLKGVKSSTTSGEVKPVRGSMTVRAGKKQVVRVGDLNTMNGGNCPGSYVALSIPSISLPSLPSFEMDPKPDNSMELDFLQQAASWCMGGAGIGAAKGSGGSGGSGADANAMGAGTSEAEAAETVGVDSAAILAQIADAIAGDALPSIPVLATAYANIVDKAKVDKITKFTPGQNEAQGVHSDWRRS